MNLLFNFYRNILHDNNHDARDGLIRIWLIILELTVKDELRKWTSHG